MGICPIIVFQGKQREKINIFHIRGLFLHIGDESGVIHGRITVRLSKKTVFVRHDGEIQLHIFIFQIRVVKILKPLGCMVEHFCVHRVFQPGGISVFHIIAVVVLLMEQMEGGECLGRSEAVPEGKLISGIILKLGHKTAEEEGIGGQLRSGSQNTALILGISCFFFKETECGKHKKQNSHENDQQKILSLFIHGITS